MTQKNGNKHQAQDRFRCFAQRWRTIRLPISEWWRSIRQSSGVGRTVNKRRHSHSRRGRGRLPGCSRQYSGRRSWLKEDRNRWKHCWSCRSREWYWTWLFACKRWRTNGWQNFRTTPYIYTFPDKVLPRTHECGLAGNVGSKSKLLLQSRWPDLSIILSCPQIFGVLLWIGGIGSYTDLIFFIDPP